jgi:hypothetical protein
MTSGPLPRLSLALVIVLAGCSNAVAGDDEVDAVSSAARKNEVRSAGVYEVPTPAHLAHVASNPVRVRLRDATATSFLLKYDLPPVIAGNDKDVELRARRQADGTWLLSGASGSGTCTESADGDVECFEHLDGVVTSLAEATAAVNAISQTEAERVARLAVAERFIIDPLGIVKFNRKR